MGSCLTHSQRHNNENRVVKNVNAALAHDFGAELVNSSENHLLKLLFEDLAARSGTEKLARDDFDVFFHLNGLWGQEIFRYFNANHHNQLSFEEFKTGLEKLVKGSIKQRVHALFSFYDTGRTNSICYFDIITMMFSYQKDELKKIIDDQKFIATLDAKEKEYHFGKSSEMEEKEVIEQIETQYTLQSHPSKTYEPSFQSKKSITSCNGSQRRSSKPLQRKSSGSISYFDALSKRNVKIASSVSMMVRKYVDFLFDELSLQKETDAMTEEQFTYLISKHQQIFNSYYEGFHNYIWQMDHNGVPISKNIPSWISSACFQNTNAGPATKIYMKYIRSTLFIYKNEGDSLPLNIINLEGLQLEQIEQDGKIGFLLKHPNGFYPEKHYLFKDTILYDEWMKHLGHLKTPSFHQKYRLMQKIGNGNFSTVYRGVQKKTNLEVAVKIMEKEKLSSVQSYIIRHECEVLELCHHPCIVKFKEKIQSKTHIFLITELLTDGDLYDYISEKKSLSEAEASFIMKQLLQTVQYLDALGLIHRDIKPENIIIRKQNNNLERVKLIDFGFAVFKNSLDSLKKCQKFAGTPGYSAPEIIKLQEYDSSVDNFSLGVLLHFLLSGTLPFDGDRNEDIKRLTVRGVFEMKGRRWQKVSEQAKDLIRGLLKPSGQRMSIQEALAHPWLQNEHAKTNS